MMPLYTYECDKCGEQQDMHRSVEHRNDCPRCRCGATTQKIIAFYRVIGDLEYYDDNLETHIKSRQHRTQVMREQNVAELYGKGWI